MNPLISVIVPIYNVEAYLPRCLDSIVNQTYRNLEIILVDDGSPDNCGAICDEYANRDSRIRVIHKENGGLSSARNAGLDIMQGEYLTFVDSDDWIALNAVQVLHDRMIRDSSDTAIVQMRNTWADGSVDPANDQKDTVLSKDQCMCLLGRKRSIPCYAWGKMYRRSVFENLRFPTINRAEDVWILPHVIENSGKISFLVDVSWKETDCVGKDHAHKARLEEADSSVTITYDLNDEYKDDVIVMTYVENQWVEAEQVTNHGDGTYTVVTADLCPVVFARVEGADESQSGGISGENVFVPSIPYKDGPDIEEGEMDGEDVGDCLVITTITEAKEKATDITQLALSHTYGSGLEDSCENARNTVSDFLYGIKIDHYVSMHMDAIAILNDAVGGVTLEVTEDFSKVDPTIGMGTVTLKGDQAIHYVRTRKDVGDQKNLSRMERQKTYIDAFVAAFRDTREEDPEFIARAYKDVSDYLVTDCSVNAVSGMIDRFGGYTIGRVVSPEGENRLGETYYEFYVDEEKLDALILELFYAPKK